MAQILKFQKGGNARKLGSLTLGITKYTADDKFIQQLYDYSKSLEPEVASQFNNIINSLKSGADLSYANHELIGDVNFDVGNPGEKRMSKRVASGLSNRETSARKAISALDNFIPEIDEIKLPKYDFTNTLSAEYERDDKGTFILDESKNKKFINSATNAAILDRINAVRFIAKNPDSTFEFTGPDGLTTKVIRDWYNLIGENNLVALERRLKDGSWSDADLETVNDINILLDRSLSNSEQENRDKFDKLTAEQTAKTNYTSRGFDPSLSAYISYDNNSGGFHIADQTLNSLIGSGNVWLNEDFLQAYPNYAFLLKNHDNGLFIINGQVYDAEDQKLLNNPVFQRFVEDNKKRSAPSNNIIKQLWTDNSRNWRPLNEWQGIEMYSPHENVWIKDITGNYNDLAKYYGQDISYVFQTRPETVSDDMFDIYGRIKPEHLTYGYINTNNEYFPVVNRDFFEDYLNKLQLSSDSKNEKYYSTIPGYLREKVTFNDGYLVRFNDNILYNPDNGVGYVNYANKWYEIPVNVMTNILKGTAGNSLNPVKRGYTEVSLPKLKQGGKIIKASGGVKVPWQFDSEIYRDRLTREILPEYKLNYTEFPEVLQLKMKLAGVDGKYIPTTLPQINLIEDLNKDIKKNREEKLYPEIKSNIPDITSSSNNEDSKFGHTKRKWPFISPDMLLGLSDYIVSDIAQRKSSEKQKEAIYHGMVGSQKQNVSEVYPIFTDNGESRMYDQRIENIRSFKPISSDVNQTYSQQLMRDAQADQLIGEKSTKLSQKYDQFLKQLLAAKMQYNQNRTQTANENWKNWNMGLGQLDMVDANLINLQGQSAKNMIYQLRENHAKDLESYKQLDMLDAKADLRTKMKYEFDRLGGYNYIKNEQIRQSFMDNNNWEGAYKYMDPEGYRALETAAYRNIILAPKNRHSWWNWWDFPVMSAKKGTKLRKTSDVLFLDQNKATTKSIDALNRDIIKLFLQMMK